MKIPEKWKSGVKSFWQGAALVLGGLLALDFLVCLIAALVSLNWLLNQVELIVVTAALLLAGILVYLPAKRIGVRRLPRLLLGFGLLGGGLVLVFFVVMYVAAFFSMMEYIRHIKADDPG